MKKILLSCLVLATAVPAAQAQAAQAVMMGINMVRLAHKGSKVTALEAPVVTSAKYRTTAYPMQRTPVAGLGILGGDQIGYLERQLSQCRVRLEADSTGSVCSAAQLAQLQATQTAITQAQPKWKMQPYTEEIAFYVAETTRRQAVATTATPTK